MQSMPSGFQSTMCVMENWLLSNILTIYGSISFFICSLSPAVIDMLVAPQHCAHSLFIYFFYFFYLAA